MAGVGVASRMGRARISSTFGALQDDPDAALEVFCARRKDLEALLPEYTDIEPLALSGWLCFLRDDHADAMTAQRLCPQRIRGVRFQPEPQAVTGCDVTAWIVAERVGFEPTVRSRVHLISSQARSAAPAPLQMLASCDGGSHHLPVSARLCSRHSVPSAVPRGCPGA